MEGFYAKYRCVKAIDLVSVGQEGTLFAGRRVVQHRNHHVAVSMVEHVEAKYRPIEEIPRKFARGCSRTSKESMGALVGWHQREDQTWLHLTRSFPLRPKVTAVDLRGQRRSETMSRGSDDHHELTTPFC